MISIGRGIRWYNNYQSEIEFCRKHNFDFMQIWFKDGKRENYSWSRRKWWRNNTIKANYWRSDTIY